MSTYNFFKNCLLKMAKLNAALEYGEITPAQALELKKEFMKFNFSDISKARAASKQSQKMKQI